jgi:hypothetical protein
VERGLSPLPWNEPLPLTLVFLEREVGRLGIDPELDRGRFTKLAGTHTSGVPLGQTIEELGDELGAPEPTSKLDAMVDRLGNLAAQVGPGRAK